MKEGLILSVFILVFAVCSYGAEPQKINFGIDKAKLESGKLQVFEEEYSIEGKGKKKRVVGVILIDASPAEVWQVLEDWDSMGAFVSGLDYYKTVHVIKPTKKGDVGESLIEGKLSIPLLTILYTLDVKFDEPNLRQEWRMISKEEVTSYNQKGIAVRKNSKVLKNIEGYEYLKPYNNGSQTLYVYAPIVTTSVPVPDFIEKALSKTTLSGYMKGVKERVESLKKQDK